MTKDLLEQSYSLFQVLEKLCWQLAYQQKQDEYNRCLYLKHKALNRYERRFKKYRQDC
jgi:hypothetical protein